MHSNKSTLILLLLIAGINANAQVIKKSVSNLNIISQDSLRQNCKSSQTLVMLNYQTGEATLKVNAESFNASDSALKRYFMLKNSDIELHFIVTKAMLDLLTKDNNEHSMETPGMLYINNHFHNVQINYSMYNKNGNTIDFANNNVFFSLQCRFYPNDFQLDWLGAYTSEPILYWISKQPINFSRTD